MESCATDARSEIFGANNQNANQELILPGTDTKMLVATSFRCAVWSENSQYPNWRVNLSLHSEKPTDLEEKIGFIVTSDRQVLQEHQDSKVPQGIKVHSHHDVLDNKVFCKLLNRGAFFTKLELHPGFFNNSLICLSNLTPTSEVESIPLPHLKTLIIKLKITLALKGNDQPTQAAYHKKHLEYLKMTKERVAENMWYILKAFKCPKIKTLDIHDAVDWEDYVVKERGFYYWGQPLFDFLQRHSSTLKSFKTIPVTVGESIGRVNGDLSVPSLQELLLWVQFPNSFGDFPEKEKEVMFHRKIDQVLQPWRDLLMEQKDLKTVVWICDSKNPWPYVNQDFIKLCQNNPKMDNLMMTLHGDEALRQMHCVKNTKPVMLSRNYQLDAGTLHGLTSLKYLSIGCYKTDPQIKHFTFYNLGLLPKSLEKIHIYGIRMMEIDIEHLVELPMLKELQILQPLKQKFSVFDENNGNIEGVTIGALKTILHARSLDKLVILGFPIHETPLGPLSSSSIDDATESKDDLPKNKAPTSFFGGFFCGSMCAPSLDDPVQSAANNDEANAPILPKSVEKYPKHFQDLLRSLGTIGEITDANTSPSSQDPLISLKIGEFSSEDSL